jgi:hypothetical protein
MQLRWNLLPPVLSKEPGTVHLEGSKRTYESDFHLYSSIELIILFPAPLKPRVMMGGGGGGRPPTEVKKRKSVTGDCVGIEWVDVTDLG